MSETKEKVRERWLMLAANCWDNEWNEKTSDVEIFFAELELALVRRAVEEAKWWAADNHAAKDEDSGCETPNCRRCKRLAALEREQAELEGR
jgi:hypothetical protein